MARDLPLLKSEGVTEKGRNRTSVVSQKYTVEKLTEILIYFG